MTTKNLQAHPSNSHRGKGMNAQFTVGRRIILAVLIFMFLVAGDRTLRSQQPSATAPGATAPTTTITSNVKVVNVLATVRDKKGAIVRNLQAEDFELQEDDHPQTIKYFAHDTDLPLILGLLVDTSLSQRRVLGQEKDASATFLDQVVRVDKDHAFIINFDHEVTLDQELTNSRDKLQAALGQLQIAQRSNPDNSSDPDSGGGQGGGGGGWGRGRGGGGGGTTLYDAVYLASNDVTAKQQGRKALIVMSDGVDRGSKKTLASAIEAAQRADTLVYSILFSDEEQQSGGMGGHGGWGGGMGGMGGMGGGMGRHGGGYPRQQESRPDGKKILQRLSKETGGRYFEVSKKHPLDETFSQIQEELRSQYSIGYTPNPPDTGYGYHKIELTTKKKDLTVQARDGYYSSQ
jgi:VWFA-related protein